VIGLDNPLHIALVLVVVLLLFGAKRLPEMGRSLGEGLRGFKHSMEGTATEFKGSLEETSEGFKESLHRDDAVASDANDVQPTETSETPSSTPAA
jgi:sec-independent protein translocase protein TatA